MSDLFYVVSIADDTGVTDSFVHEGLAGAEHRMAELREWGGPSLHVCYTPVSRTLDPVTLAREVLRAGEAAWHLWSESAHA